MLNRKVLYFYEYASEVRGRCLGHARVLVCGQTLRLTLAFSLPGWKKEPRKLYFIAEDCKGNIRVVLLGDIMPCEIMTVYNLEMQASRLGNMKISDIMHVCFFLQGEENRHLKAVCGILDITEKRLEKLLCDNNLVEEKVKEAKTSKEPADDEATAETVCVVEEAGEQKNHEYRCENHADDMTEAEAGCVKNEGKCPSPMYKENKEAYVTCRESGVSYFDVNAPEKLKKRISELLMIRPEYQPFRTKKISCSVRIGIGDVIGISEFESGLKDNSFLLHGFYRYKHVLLAGALVREHMEYYILVPGIKNEREQRLADMYGFHEFLTLDGQSGETGAFGYYLWLLLS